MKKRGVAILFLLMVVCLVTALPCHGEDKKGDVYVIKKGDTLWDLSDEFLKDPYLWPELWQNNQYITNPHLIYPGNSLRLHGKPMPMRPEGLKTTEAAGEAVTGAETISKTAETREAALAPEEVERGGRPEGEDVVQVLRQGGGVQLLIVEEESLGMIIDARYRKRLLCQGDTVYIAMKERVPDVGERYTIFRTTQTLKNPYTKKTTKKVYVLGSLKVTATKGVLYQAEITDSFDGIWRGDEVMTYRVLQ
jgi:hypothetical protein